MTASISRRGGGVTASISGLGGGVTASISRRGGGVTASISGPGGSVDGAVSHGGASALTSPVSVGPSAITISKLSLRGEMALGVAPRMSSGEATWIATSAGASGIADALGVAAFSWLKAGALAGGWVTQGGPGSCFPARSGTHHLSVGSRPCGPFASGPTLPLPESAAVSDEAAEG